VRGVDGAAETGAAAGEVPRDAAARAHEGRTGPLGENARRSGPGGRDRRRWCAATEPLGRHRAPGAGRGGAGSDGDFFALLQTTRGMRPDDGSWWAQAQPAAPVTERLAALQRVIAGAPSAPHPTPHPAPRALPHAVLSVTIFDMQTARPGWPRWRLRDRSPREAVACPRASLWRCAGCGMAARSERKSLLKCTPSAHYSYTCGARRKATAPVYNILLE
jgi:hypothetical protein